MAQPKRRVMFALCSLFAAVVILGGTRPAFAVVGQLDWQLPSADQQTTITLPPAATDNKALDTCRKKSEEATASLKNCQDATKILKDASDASSASRRLYLTTTIVSSSIAIVLAFLLILVLVRKKPSSPLPASTSSSVS